jgi:hypothetical protein
MLAGARKADPARSLHLMRRRSQNGTYLIGRRHADCQRDRSHRLGDDLGCRRRRNPRRRLERAATTLTGLLILVGVVVVVNVVALERP